VDFGDDDEILQDFLVEAGEILELLGEQLVELEQRPEDSELLNAVFRGFHTVKGGAGFLNIVAMIDVCHRAEDVFNVLRQGERVVDAELMDAVLKVLDILNEQFTQLNEGEQPVEAEASLLKRLEEFAQPGNVSPSPISATSDDSAVDFIDKSPSSKPSSVSGSDDITEEEFESLLDALDTNPAESNSDTNDTVVAPSIKNDGDISDDEFEALLDDIHGKGQHQDAASSANNKKVPADNADKETVKPAPVTSAPKPSGQNEDITDTEFENILDVIHGQGKINTSSIEAEKVKSSINKVKSAPTATAQEKGKGKGKDAEATSAKQVSVRSSDATVRVDTKRLDDIMNMVGELVLVRNRLDTLKIKMNDEDINKAVANLDIVTSDLQAAVMKTRMQPIKKVFGRFPRVVRDLARNLKKEVNLELMGEETDLDKNLVEALADPMVHLVRNSVDHGVEMPDERESAGKKRAGTIVLSAAQEGDHILLTIEDDGAGMDANLLRKIAVERGVMDKDAAARLDDSEAFNLIFAPGFSTKSKISDISGRGVGMDVVKTRISQLNGTIDIESAKGRGTKISIKLPLTLAILPTLMVKVADRTFALPLSSVNEIFSIESHNTNMVDGQLVIMVRNKAMPLFYLYKWLAKKGVESPEHSDQVVVANVGNQKVGFVVNQVVGQEEVVIKPLGAMLHGLPGFAGATITGDGRIALILDIPSLMKARVNAA